MSDHKMRFLNNGEVVVWDTWAIACAPVWDLPWRSEELQALIMRREVREAAQRRRDRASAIVARWREEERAAA